MKSKTIYIVLGIAAVGGAVWYFKNKQGPTNSNAAVLPTTSTGMLTKTVSPVQIVNLPATLIAPSNSNTGIVPPVLSTAPTPIPKMEPVQAKPRTLIAILKAKSMAGFGNAYSLN